jgi:uncharacterized membrane protein YccC
MAAEAVPTDRRENLHLPKWLGERDRDFAALRRACRAAIVMPAMFAIGDKAIGNAAIATFAAFGSFSMLLLVDFGGPMRARLQALAALGVGGCAFVCLGTLASTHIWLAAAAMVLIGFAVIFIGVVSSVLAAASTSLLLAFILPVSLDAPVSTIPECVAGWAIAAGAALLAVGLLWPTPVREPLRAASTNACRALAARLRAEVAYLTGGRAAALGERREIAVAKADGAIAELHRSFLATPYRPTHLGTASRTIVRLVDELVWLNRLAIRCAHAEEEDPVGAALSVELAAAGVLEEGAKLLDSASSSSGLLTAALQTLTEALRGLEQRAVAALPAGELVSSRDPSFRAEELGYGATLVGRDIELATAAEARSWLQRVLGREPEGTSGPLLAARKRAGDHLDRNSVWLHNSVRGAIGLGLAVFVANRTGVQHSFWVVLGALSVLRSNALSTGQSILRALGGTVVGFVVGAALLAAIGTNATLLWFLLPIAILLAGIAPAAISFAAGQAAFTLTLVFLFNIIQPIGWRVGLLRVEDIAIGCGVSLVVGLLFWPRGAGAALRHALADAYAETAAYLASAVDFGMIRCDAAGVSNAAPSADAERAAGAGQRLDDAFRNFLTERGAKPLPLPAVTSLITGVGGLRLAGDAVLDLWRREDGSAAGDRAAARTELLRASGQVRGWYAELADSLRRRSAPPTPQAEDESGNERLLAAVRRDLGVAEGAASGTAIRMIWTGDHLDAARRVQELIVEPAQAAAEQLVARDRR